MKKLFPFLLLILLIQSCKNDEINIPTCDDCNFTCIDVNDTDVITNACSDNWDCSFMINSQSKIDINEYEGLTSGDKNVFQMINSTIGDPLIADDETTNIFVFELDDSQNSFSAEDNQLTGLKVHYKTVCFCANVEFLEITAGCLQGEKQTDGTWFVQGNLTVPFSTGSLPVKFEAQFVN